jgi:hypothetical protein
MAPQAPLVEQVDAQQKSRQTPDVQPSSVEQFTPTAPRGAHTEPLQ